MATPLSQVPSGSQALALIQNLDQVFSAAGLDPNAEFGTILNAFRTVILEVKQESVAKDRQIAALEASNAQLTAALQAEKSATETLQKLVRSNETNHKSLYGTVVALQGTVNADHDVLYKDHTFLYQHVHSETGCGRTGQGMLWEAPYTGRK